jgi:hypothetical protein
MGIAYPIVTFRRDSHASRCSFDLKARIVAQV